MNTRSNFTISRQKELDDLDHDLYHDLEKSYGKYLFVPFAIAKIIPRDIEKFKDFFFDKCTTVSKIPEKMGNSTLEGQVSFQSIDSVSPSRNTQMFPKHPVPEIYNNFPEIFEQIHDLMPWVGNEDFRWTMWSSISNIGWHRDSSSMLDIPNSVRILLYDNNTTQSLSLKLSPPEKISGEELKLPIPEDTNSFAWNNLRTKHQSVFNEPYRKILFIYRDRLSTKKQINQYVDLLEKSINKYKDQLLIDVEHSRLDYLID